MNMSTLVGIAFTFKIFMWSLYPLASSYSLEVMNPFALMFAVQLAAYLGAMTFAIIALARRRQFREYAELQVSLGWDGIWLIVGAGACSAFSHVFFVMALTMVNKNGVSILFESWPIMALFFAPHIIEKDWRKSTARDYIIGAVALAGVCIIILSDEHITMADGSGWDVNAFLAYGLALVASYLTAMLVLMRGSYGQKLQPLKNNFAGAMISEMMVRFVATILLAVVGLAFGFNMTVPTSEWSAIIFIGVGIFALGGAAYTFALVNARSPNIMLFDYLIPILAVVWLVMAGMSEINAGLIIGGTMTIGSCVYLLWCNNRQKKAEARQAQAAV